MTALKCPDCPGVLEIVSKGEHLRFSCRIGHVYSLRDLIESKESRLENHLWAPVTALQELVALLRDVLEQGKTIGSPGSYEARAKRAEEHAEALRKIIEENEPLDLAAGPPGGCETP